MFSGGPPGMYEVIENNETLGAVLTYKTKFDIRTCDLSMKSVINIHSTKKELLKRNLTKLGF